jgi:hypothetical protein
MRQRAHAVRPKDSTVEQARARNRKPGKWYDFDDLIDGKRQREGSRYFRRGDGQFMFYHGKENAIYGETEAGKDMMLAELACQAIEDEVSVCWIDFEESDEIDAGNRMLEIGLATDLLRDQDLFRFATPEDMEQATNAVYSAYHGDPPADIIILNGIQAGYSLFGWDINDPVSTQMFRTDIVRPCLDAGCTVIETDHISKSSSSRNGGGRYASGGIAKLNWVSGAAYMLEAHSPIIRGGNGKSKLFLVKDRPGSIKPTCIPTDDPGRMYAGMLSVKSNGDGDSGWNLNIDIIPPHPAPDNFVMLNGMKIAVTLIDKILELYKDHGKEGASKATIESECKGNGTRYIRAAIDIAKSHGCLVPAEQSRYSHTKPLQFKKSWDQKLGVTQKK